MEKIRNNSCDFNNNKDDYIHFGLRGVRLNEQVE
jgi:hypothetical protein